MLDAQTKRRIDTARDILVGKVPDPKSQVEQITIALIYKFMDDMDAQAEELGGQRTFFAGDFAKYSWPQLTRAGLGGFEMLNLYAEAIARMPENQGIPQLFRTVFSNAFLPYRDPETLRLFLKTIDEFSYDDSESLGDAFEYLLSVMGAQGDAGQFRTPRHIIDFIVSVIDPRKEETILDPACGTAGFLISAYQYILAANTDANGQSALTPDDRVRLVNNFKGYDISPDMVRLSVVNMYLHGFWEPHIYEYDTLTSEERWNEYADVILANPPFMSPKGGIRPHDRFSIQSRRSEVLFVDYMAEHLTTNGRAGIIVPEGIIFQSQTAYRQLRKMMVENYLVAVVSLPAGVFNPYSGVKTSILILDRALARRADSIAFFKVENDGFDLGAQRRPVDRNDLPKVQAELGDWLSRQRAGNSVDEPPLTHGQVVSKGSIAEDGEYNLSGERYRDTDVRRSRYDMLPFKEVCTLEYGASLPKSERIDGPYPVMGSNGISGYHNEFLVRGPAIVVGRKGSAGEVTYVSADCFPIDTTYYVSIVDNERTDISYLYRVLKSLELPRLRGGAGIPGLNRNDVYQKFQLPIPPMSIQREIVAEIEGYQKVIDGARAVVENYRPHIVVDPKWPMVELGEVCTVVRGSSPRPKGASHYYGGPIPRLMVADITRDGMYSTPKIDSLTKEGAAKSRPMNKGDVIVTVSGNPGLPTILAVDACIHDGFVGLRDLNESINREYLYWNLLAQHNTHGAQSVGAVFKNLTTHQVRDFRIPLPSQEIQEAIANEIASEQALVEANRELVRRFEGKIKEAVARVWSNEADQRVDA